MVRILSALISIVVLSACNGASDLDKPAVPLGDFNLYHNIVVAPKVQKLPISREVSVSFSLGRASRLKKPPGILPTE